MKKKTKFITLICILFIALIVTNNYKIIDLMKIAKLKFMKLKKGFALA